MSKLTLKNFIKAITEKLEKLYPEKIVHIGEIPREADGNFYVRLLDSSQEKHLDRRRKRHLQFEVLYFCVDRDTLEYLDWAEVMYDNFEQLTVAVGSEGETRTVCLRNQKAYDNKNTAMYQFLFDADFYFVLKAEDESLMETLTQKERTRE